MNKFYVIPYTKDLSIYNEDLILPLEGYSIGFDVYFTCQEIESLASTRNVSVIINSFLHKDAIESIKPLLDAMKSVKYFFIEDLGLLNLIDRSKIVLFQNHIINNYDSINYFKNININNIVVSNELTLNELRVIREKTTSNLFYFLVNRNMLLYSKRGLVSSYYKYKGINDDARKKEIIENVSKKKMIIKEENGRTAIFDSNIFSANEYLDYFDNFNFIINFSNLTNEESKLVLEHYKSKDLRNYINVDNYFVNNKIIYKVGEK